ncbi:hypothetical protein I2I05_16500 [Hymenobacter sp. BT683]|uniref:Uncharacterized protein n=1 Tax=Hymenobacter jeongseonensis TaxID=2791027 RepID=A0ABS0IKV8_9BACT|nr:hypothetical protein [Hymenobacter jeongseonensis]MBF9239004.1 hypothetical protein [Hymenobacter jeongseonensis]
MNSSSKAVIIGIAILSSSVALMHQWQWFKKWVTNTYEYRSTLFIVISDNAPKNICIYTNCFTGTDLEFKSGYSAIYAGDGKNNIFIQDKLEGLTIRIIDEKSVPKTSKSHLPDEDFYSNSKRVIRIESKDSTSFCGLYKTIILQ